RLKQIVPKPHSVERAETLPAIERFLTASPDAELVWLSDGVDLGKGAEFVDGLARVAANHPLTVIEGGVPPARALAAADNAEGGGAPPVLRAARRGGGGGRGGG